MAQTPSLACAEKIMKKSEILVKNVKFETRNDVYCVKKAGKLLLLFFIHTKNSEIYFQCQNIDSVKLKDLERDADRREGLKSVEILPRILFTQISRLFL